MILFVFEGDRREIEVFKTLETLYFPTKLDSIICSFGNDIYELYRTLTDGQDSLLYCKDLVSVLRERDSQKEDNPFSRITDSSQISEVYLFFDYDIHNQNEFQSFSMGAMNRQIAQMLDFFSDETDQGKLYINYPMVESIRYTKKLPDGNFWKYDVDLEKVGSFKEDVDTFSYYKNNDFMSFRLRHGEITQSSLSKMDSIRENWMALNCQNIMKANYICCEQNKMPESKTLIAQEKVFASHLCRYFPKGKVPVLSSFPLFLYEYFEKSDVILSTSNREAN